MAEYLLQLFERDGAVGDLRDTQAAVGGGDEVGETCVRRRLVDSEKRDASGIMLL